MSVIKEVIGSWAEVMETTPSLTPTQPEEGGGITTAAARNSSVKIFNDQILSCLYHLLADELNETVRIFLEDLIRQIDSKPNVGSFASNQSDNESTGQPHSPSYILCVSGRPANANNGEY